MVDVCSDPFVTQSQVPDRLAIRTFLAGSDGRNDQGSLGFELAHQRSQELFSDTWDCANCWNQDSICLLLNKIQ